METYLLVNLVFLAGVWVAFRMRFKKPTKANMIALVALLVLTAVFDSLIVGFGIVGYDSEKILGLYIGNAPVEDFFYAILAALLIPALWERMEKKHV